MSGAVAALPATLERASAEQPGARVALAAALANPTHAYLFVGPPGAGKRESARALAAELISAGAEDVAAARRRALADPPLHPDLTWVRPIGTQHLVDQVRERVIEAAAYRPFESERRVFVIEAAEAMAEESQNALLKTLEEPAAYAHLILISSHAGGLLDTVRSRCSEIRFAALAPRALAERLVRSFPAAAPGELEAVARLAGGDGERAELLVSESGRTLRAAAERVARACVAGGLNDAPWRDLLAAASEAGELAGTAARTPLDELAEQMAEIDERAARRLRKEAEDDAKRAIRRGRLDALDTGLGLIAAWLRDLAAAADGAGDLALTADRLPELTADAEGVDPGRARRGAELVQDTRRRLTVNVSEELALEALCFRLEFVLRSA